MNEPPTPLPRDTVLCVGLAVVVILLWFAILPIRPLFNPDEGRYAEIPREMRESGDWVIPHLDGVAYVEKPPLQYWATAISLGIFGENAFGARFYTALCALLTLGTVWWLAARLWDRAAAWRAAFALSGMALFVILGQLLTLDMSLTFYLTLALAGFLATQRAAAPRFGMWFTWAAIALGVMTKGPVAALIPAAVLVTYSVLTRDFGPWRRLQVGAGVPIFLLIAVPWYWLAARRQADFLRFFFVHEHFARYLTPSADREEPWWFFGAVYLAGSLPWSVSALRILATGWQRTVSLRLEPRNDAALVAFDTRRFLWVWIAFTLLFFSVSDSKLIPYVLPVMPPLALLIATGEPARRRRDALLGALLSVLAALMLGIVCLLAPRMLEASVRNTQFLALSKPLLQIAALLLLSGVFVMVARNRDSTRGIALIGTGWGVATLLAMRGATAVAGIYSGATLLPALEQIPAGAPIYSVATYDQTLPFYLRRTLTLVSYRGELDFGLAHASGVASLSLPAFIDKWRGGAPAFALMEIDMFDRLSAQGLAMHELARDARQIVVSQP